LHDLNEKARNSNDDKKKHFVDGILFKLAGLSESFKNHTKNVQVEEVKINVNPIIKETIAGCDPNITITDFANLFADKIRDR